MKHHRSFPHYQLPKGFKNIFLQNIIPLSHTPTQLSIAPGTFPVDTTKTRLQIQGQVRDTSCRHVKYRGMTHALYKIYQEEGLRALYRGYVVYIYIYCCIFTLWR